MKFKKYILNVLLLIIEYKRHFRKDNIHVIIFEELVKNSDKGLNELEDFLKVKRHVLKLEYKYNSDKITKIIYLLNICNIS